MTATDTVRSAQTLDPSHGFEDPAVYDAQLTEGIRLSGEDKRFFIDGRLADLRGQLPSSWAPSRILDFGCGTGDTTAALHACYPTATVIGVDVAGAALDWARRNYASPTVTFADIDALPSIADIDLCYVNGVFHHIVPSERPAAVASILRALRPGGILALFENNPWNPGTKMVMRRIPFDRDAQTLSVLEARRLLLSSGFRTCTRGRFLFYFPRPLQFLRPIERVFTRLPLGAQYWLLAVK